jgi:hypothetical protein
MRFVAVTVVRGKTLRFAAWKQMLDLDGPDARWFIPADLMKGKEGGLSVISVQKVPLRKVSEINILHASGCVNILEFL